MYTGCISCFGCKKEKFKGRCVCRDGLTPVLDAIRSADGLIIGSPNYLGELTASFRALYERLIFQNLTYNVQEPCCSLRSVPVLLIMTSNAPDTAYSGLLRNYQQTLSRFVGPTELLVSGDTLQLKDYSRTDWEWSMFDPEAKKLRHETVFQQECEKAFARAGGFLICASGSTGHAFSRVEAIHQEVAKERDRNAAEAIHDIMLFRQQS